MSDFRNQVDALSVAEKAELLDAVWESLEGDMPALTDEQRAELDDRMARYARNPETVIPWEKVRAGMGIEPRRFAIIVRPPRTLATKTPGGH